MSRKVILLDLDDTVICEQSQKLFLQYLFAQKLVGWMYFAKVYWWFILYKVGIVGEPRKIMEYAYAFVAGKSVAQIDELSYNFFQNSLKKYIYPEAVELIKKHQKQRHVIIIVSNAAECIVKQFAQFMNITHYIATPLKVVSGIYTGELDGHNVYGRHKIAYIKKMLSEQGLDLSDSVAYSDHFSDMPMLRLASISVAVNPDKKLLKEAQKMGWKIVTFKKI